MADGRHFLTRITWQQDSPAGQIRKGLLAARFRKEAGQPFFVSGPRPERSGREAVQGTARVRFRPAA